MRHVKQEIRAAQRDQSGTAFVKSYEAGPDFAFPQDFNLARYNLLLCESMRREERTAILLYWVSEERANAQEPLVVKILGINVAQPVGSVIEILTPKPPKWIENPVKWGKWIVSAAAIFGAMSVIRDNFTGLFAFPHVVLFASNSASQNYHLGDSLDIPIVVRNEARLGSADVQLKTATLRPLDSSAGSRPLRLDISEVPQLQAGQNVDVHISGLAPATGTHQTGPEKYALEIAGQAEAGWLWRWKAVTYTPYIVSSWPDRVWESRLIRMSPQAAQIQITLHSGKNYPSGIRGQLTFESSVAPAKNGIALMVGSPFSGAKTVEGPFVAGNAAGSIGKIEFQTDPLQPFHRYSYAISIAFKRTMSELEWNDLRSAMTVKFE
jgi:hypothetical protein